MGKFKDLDSAIQGYVEHLQDNYNTTASGQFITFTYEIGRKYAHVIMNHFHHYDNTLTQRSSHSWIMLQDDKKFKLGDVLKSASWKAPARNFKRGNVLANDYYNIRWCGA
jgi:endo-1,4-beta-mannosidase